MIILAIKTSRLVEWTFSRQTANTANFMIYEKHVLFCEIKQKRSPGSGENDQNCKNLKLNNQNSSLHFVITVVIILFMKIEINMHSFIFLCSYTNEHRKTQSADFEF